MIRWSWTGAAGKEAIELTMGHVFRLSTPDSRLPRHELA